MSDRWLSIKSILQRYSLLVLLLAGIPGTKLAQYPVHAVLFLTERCRDHSGFLLLTRLGVVCPQNGTTALKGFIY